MTGSNGSQKPSFVRNLIGLVEDHVELASLELNYAKQEGRRRLIGLAVGAVFALCAFLFLQVALMFGLMALGLTAGIACLILGGVYAAVALGVMAKYGRSDPETRDVFQGSRQELGRSLKWIEKHFS